MPKSRYTRDKARGGYRYNFRQANGKYTTLRAATAQEMDDLIRQKSKERDKILRDHPPVTPGISVSEVCARWIPVASAELEYKSREALNYAAKKITDKLGSVEMAKLSPADVDDLLLSMAGMSSSVKQKVLRTLRRIVRYAEENNWITSDPTQGKTPGGKKPAEVTALTPVQQRVLLDAVKDTRAYLFVLLCLRAGLRREEALGLTWDYVHLDAPAWIEVAGVIVFEHYRPVYKTSGKTPAAHRKIPIPDELAQALEEERKTNTSRFVLHDKNGNACGRQSFFAMWQIVQRRYTARASERHIVDLSIDFAVHPHQLRHTYISELCAHSAETGLDIKTIQYLAGHTNPTTTLKIYAHVMQERSDTADKIRAIFG